jgi:hypothetical protein
MLQPVLDRRDRLAKHVEYLAGWPAPTSGVYRLINELGTKMSAQAHVARGAPLPAAPPGYGWRVELGTDKQQANEFR